MTHEADLFGLLAAFAPEEFHVVRRRDLGLTAFIALDDLRLGPACGGIRWRRYPHPVDGARDVLRLARAMTYKNALAGLDFGGGKTVVLCDDALDPARAFPALGEAIEGLGGRYVTACDYGTTARELALVKTRTRHALAEEADGALDMGTATGVLAASRAIWRRLTAAPTLAGARIVVQGVGDVGLPLVRLLLAEGAEVVFAEVDEARAAHCLATTGARRIAADRVFASSMDVFCPCAVGEVITEDVARTLPARGVAGAANNQLATDEIGEEVERRGMLYAPDYAVNAGGLMNVSIEFDGYNRERAMRMMRTIYYNLGKIFQIAKRDSIPTFKAADRMAEERIAAIGRIKLPHMGNSAPRFLGRMRGA